MKIPTKVSPLDLRKWKEVPLSSFVKEAFGTDIVPLGRGLGYKIGVDNLVSKNNNLKIIYFGFQYDGVTFKPNWEYQYSKIGNLLITVSFELWSLTKRYDIRITYTDSTTRPQKYVYYTNDNWVTYKRVEPTLITENTYSVTVPYFLSLAFSSGDKGDCSQIKLLKIELR